MIFTWLKLAAYFLLRLIIPPPPEPVIRQIDKNAPCPSCGHRDGTLRAVNENGTMYVKHTCNVCLAVYKEKPVLDVSKLIDATPQPENKG